MTKPEPTENRSPAQQAGEENGRIKKPQRNERDMVDLPRGSEVETRASAQRR
jgi:hypothetical protein